MESREVIEGVAILDRHITRGQSLNHGNMLPDAFDYQNQRVITGQAIPMVERVGHAFNFSEQLVTFPPFG